MTISRLLTVAILAIAQVGLASSPAQAIPPPQSDPFYSPPSGWAKKAPGTILRSRPVTLAFISALPKRTEAWQLLYRTTDHDGRPMSTATLALRAPDGPRPQTLLSYQVPTDAVAPQCAPSYIFQHGSGNSAILNQIELPLINAGLAAGNVVVLPDYQGPRGEWGAPRQPGYAILDGLRAARQFAPLGLPGRKTPTVLWGYSGGSLASGWAAELHPTYAPDLDLRGVAIGGYVTLPLDVIKTLNGSPWAGLMVSVIPGMMRGSNAVDDVFNRNLNARGKAILADSVTLCDTENLTKYAFTNFDNLMTIPWRDFTALPEVISAFRDLELGGATPTAPLYVYHAATDEVVPIQGADTTVSRYCAGGASFTYDRFLVGEHVTTAVTSAPTALAWMSKRLRGEPAPSGCTTATNVVAPTTPDQLSGVVPLADGFLSALLG